MALQASELQATAPQLYSDEIRIFAGREAEVILDLHIWFWTGAYFQPVDILNK